jgi:hypothetical protein
LLQAPDEAVVERVVEDVFDRVGVLLLRLDQFRPEAPAENVVVAPVALVEGAGVAAVEIAHPVGEVRKRGLDDHVVVVAHQATDVDAPFVAVHDAVEDVEKERAVVVVPDDRRVKVPTRHDVIEGPGGEVTAWAAHPSKVPPPGVPKGDAIALATGPARARYVPGTGQGTRGLGGCGRVRVGRGRLD